MADSDSPPSVSRYHQILKIPSFQSLIATISTKPKNHPLLYLSSVQSNRIEKRHYSIPPAEQRKFIYGLPEKVRLSHYGEIEDLWFDFYEKHELEMPDFELRMLEFIKDYPKAVAEFKTFLPTAVMVPVPGAGVDPDKTVFVSKGGFMDRVRDALYENTQFYLDWLRNLRSYKHGSICFKEFKFKVSSLFEKHPDLFKELDRYVNKEKTDQTDEENSTSTETEVSSSAAKEPESKRRKTE